MALADSTSLSLLHRLVRQKTLVPVISMLEAVKLALEGVGALLGAVGFYLIGLRGTLVLGGLTLPVLLVFWRRRLVETDSAADDHSRIVALLYGVPLFHVPDMVFLEDLASRTTQTSVQKGAAVVTLGEEGDTFYVIASGHVRVEIDGYPVGELGPGSSFGERALLRNNPGGHRRRGDPARAVCSGSRQLPGCCHRQRGPPQLRRLFCGGRERGQVDDCSVGIVIRQDFSLLANGSSWTETYCRGLPLRNVESWRPAHDAGQRRREPVRRSLWCRQSACGRRGCRASAVRRLLR